MIRRDMAADGAADCWALIAQIDHARLAARLAEHWGAPPLGPLRPRDALLWAIEHHDDGWHNWDQEPRIDPRTGAPRSFTEMPPADAVAIWTASIDAAAARGPLEGALVAGHFCALARRAGAWHQHDPQWPHMEAFLADYEARAQAWRATWQRQGAARHTTALADEALARLQFFDALSLWFCCAAATQSDALTTPEGIELTLTPHAPDGLRIGPWPFTVRRLNLEVQARLVPAARYDSERQLAAAPAQSIHLRWRLAADA